MLTQRLVRWIGESGVKRSFVSIASEVGLNEKTVRAVFGEYTRGLSNRVQINAGPSMALLGQIIMGSKRYVIVNTGSRMITELVEEPTLSGLTKTLGALGKPETVERLGIGFDALALDAIRNTLPHAHTFIDPLFVQEMLHEGVRAARDLVRAALRPPELRCMRGDLRILLANELDLNADCRSRLHDWLARYPLLGEAHMLKERVMSLYGAAGAATRQEGGEGISTAIGALSPPCKALFHPFVENWTSWREQILNAFENDKRAYLLGITTGAEMAGLLERYGREYCFAALRAKLRSPSGIPAFTLSSPGTSIARLRAMIEGPQLSN